jgi:hypothetical protein
VGQEVGGRRCHQVGTRAVERAHCLERCLVQGCLELSRLGWVCQQQVVVLSWVLLNVEEPRSCGHVLTALHTATHTAIRPAIHRPPFYDHICQCPRSWGRCRKRLPLVSWASDAVDVLEISNADGAEICVRSLASTRVDVVDEASAYL